MILKCNAFYVVYFFLHLCIITRKTNEFCIGIISQRIETVCTCLLLFYGPTIFHDEQMNMRRIFTIIDNSVRILSPRFQYWISFYGQILNLDKWCPHKLPHYFDASNCYLFSVLTWGLYFGNYLIFRFDLMWMISNNLTLHNASITCCSLKLIFTIFMLQ